MECGKKIIGCTIAVVTVLVTSLEPTYAQTSAPACEAMFTSDNGKAAALMRARDAGYVVEQTEIKVDGISRKIVFLGETHVKKQKTAEIGRDVLEHFPVVGYEGAEGFKKFLPMRIFGAITMGGYALAEKLGFSGSTIKDARKRDPQPGVRNINLESGHEFTGKEKAKFGVVMFDAALGLVQSTIFILPAIGFIDGAIHAEWVSAGFSFFVLKFLSYPVYAVTEGALKIVGYRDFAERCFNAVFCAPRDTFMVKKTVEAFHADPTLDQMLVIVGSEHVPGMAWRFKQENPDSPQ